MGVQKGAPDCSYASPNTISVSQRLKLWGESERKEIEALERIVDQLDGLIARAGRLPVSGV